MSGYIKIAAAAVIWGSLAIIVRFIDVPVPVIVLYRIIFAALAVFALTVAQGKLEELRVGTKIFYIAGMGALLALNWTAFFYSVRLTSIANAVLITYTAPVLVALLAPFVLKERLERITILTLGVALLGAVFVAAPTADELTQRNMFGLLWAVVSAITYAGLVLMAKPITAKVSVLAILFYEEVFCALILSPAYFFYDFTLDLPTFLLLVITGVVHTALAAGLYLSGLRDVKAQQVGIFTYLDPVSAVIFAAFFLGEIPDISTLFGGLLIIASGLALVVATRQRIETEVVAE